RTRVGGACCPHGRARACATDREPPLLTLIACRIIDRDTGGRIGIERNIGRGALALAIHLRVLAETRLRAGRRFVHTATATAAAPAGLPGKSTAGEMQGRAADGNDIG